MRRVIVVVAVLSALAGLAAWYFRTCCAPPPHMPANSVPSHATPAPPPAAGAPASDTARPSETTRDGSMVAAAPKRRSAAPPPAPPETTGEVAPATGASLRIVSDVPGAQVFLNREFVGTTPTAAASLAPGEYQLNVAAPGYDNHVETVTVGPGEREIIVNFRAVRLDASLDVVHKHRFGSCRGRLVATPDGMRYETTDTDDAFSAALLDLQTFEVDYVNKNLRVQVRKGKRYDFTDPEANADRLFVFHRDVGRARERLRAER